MFRAHLYKLVRSPLLYIAVLAVLSLCLCSLFSNHKGNSVIGAFNMLIDLESYRKMFVLFAALPFVSNFANEWNSKSTINCVTRKSIRSYAASNAFVCFISSFAAVFTGMMIYILIQSARLPLYEEDGTDNPYKALFENGKPFLAIVIIVFVYSLSCAMWSVMGLAASSFFPSKYVSICAPFVFCYIIERFTKYFPSGLRLGALSKSVTTIISPLFTFINALFVFGGLSVLCGTVFTLKVKRRVENELS